MLARITQRRLIGLLALCASGCADSKAHSCNALVEEGSYLIQYDELSHNCLVPLRSILPDQLIRSEDWVQIRSNRSVTTSEVSWGCTASVEILKYDLDNAARVIVRGVGLVEAAGAVRGRVAVELSRIENASEIKPSPDELESALLTPLCETQALATLTLSADAGTRSND